MNENFKEVSATMPPGTKVQDTVRKLAITWHGLSLNVRKKYQEAFAKRQETDSLLKTLVRGNVVWDGFQ